MMNFYEKLEFLELDEQFDQMKELKHLYKESFPDAERKPFGMILKGMKQGSMQCFVLLYEGELAGLAFVILGKTAHVLDYLAIDPQMQGKSLGSIILKQLSEIYDKPLVVEIESTIGLEDKNSQPVRRKQFYERNDFLSANQEIEFFGVEMELMSTKRQVLFDEYEKIMQDYFRMPMKKFLKLYNPASI